MGYSKDIRQKARTQLDESRAYARADAERRRLALFSELPRLAEIEKELSVTGLSAARAAIGGTDDTPALIERLRERNQSLQSERAGLLRSAGLPQDALAIRYNCQVCEDTGYVGRKQCECFTRLLQKLAYEKLSDTSGVVDCGFDNFRLDYYPTETASQNALSPRRAMERIFSDCREYARKFSRESDSLLFLGSTGLGKTHLSLAIAREVIVGGYGVVYTTAPLLLERLQNQQFSRTGGDETDYLALAAGCDLLIIDDLGAEFSTTFTVAALYNLINTRITERRPVIISTNYDNKTLSERYGDRLLSRLFGTYRLFQFVGKDIRIVKRKQGL